MKDIQQFFLRCTWLCLAWLATPAFALTPVTMQLRWNHQFQFAGYYAALEKGFYRDAGLDVTLKEGGSHISATEEVLQGRAQFGVTNSGLVKTYMTGQPVLMLAPIVQHSPTILLSLGDKLHNPADVAKAGVIRLQPGDESLEQKSLFVNEGIALDKLKITTEQHGIDGGCVKTKRILAPPGQSDERAVPFSRFFDLRMSQGRLMAFERHHGSPDDDEFVNKEPQAPASLIALIRLETPRMRITRLRL